MLRRSNRGANPERHRLCLESLENRCLLTVGPLTLEPLANFDRPVVATHAGDGSGRLFVAEQGGLIHTFRNGDTAPQPFLDLRSELVIGGGSGEVGLLGLAFHPDFAKDGSDGEGQFYVYYSAPALSGGDHDSVVAEFHVSATDPDVADIDSERTILRFSQPHSGHNAGDLKFGPDDGLLYVSSGDGGRAGDPAGHGQDGNTLLGAILRIDVKADDFPNDPMRNYAIPASNPFTAEEQFRDEIFAFGLRNPFRMSFDDGPQGRLSPDRLFTGDVGQDKFEEVNIIRAGGNYGWNVCEGDHVYNDVALSCPDQFVPPIDEYGRGVGISVIGGFVYRGMRFPQLDGIYLFGDLNGTLMALEEQGNGSFRRSTPVIEGDTITSIIGFGEDESGELYALSFTEMRSIRLAPTVIGAAGEVFVTLHNDEIVVGNKSEELLRAPFDSLASLQVNLSAGNDRITLDIPPDLFDSFLSVDGGLGDDELVWSSSERLDLTTLASDRLTNLEAIDMTDQAANSLTLGPSEVERLSSTTDTVRITHDASDTIDYGDGWIASQPTQEGGQFVHRLIQDHAIVEIANTRPFQNPLVRYDADRDGDITPKDVLRIVNALVNQPGPLVVPASLDDPFTYLDVSGDRKLSALDALHVINEYSRGRATAAPSPSPSVELAVPFDREDGLEGGFWEAPSTKFAQPKLGSLRSQAAAISSSQRARSWWSNTQGLDKMPPGSSLP